MTQNQPLLMGKNEIKHPEKLTGEGKRARGEKSLRKRHLFEQWF